MGLIDKFKNFIGRLLFGVDIEELKKENKRLKQKIFTQENEIDELKDYIDVLKKDKYGIKTEVEEIFKETNLKFIVILDFKIKGMSKKSLGSISDFNLIIEGVTTRDYSKEEILTHFKNKTLVCNYLVKGIETEFAPQQIIGLDSKAGGDFVSTSEQVSLNLNCGLTINNGKIIKFKKLNDLR